MKATQEQIQSAITKVLTRSAGSADYRARALKEPVAVINEAGGLDLPLNTPIRFADSSEEVALLLPPFGSDPDEISEDEMLASVSGGVTPVAVVCATIVFTAATAAAVAGIIQEANKKPRPGPYIG